MARVEAWGCDAPRCETWGIGATPNTPPTGWIKVNFSEVGGREKVADLLFCSKECAGEFFHPRPRRGRPPKAA